VFWNATHPPVLERIEIGAAARVGDGSGVGAGGRAGDGSGDGSGGGSGGRMSAGAAESPP
jgi:hypothetical protein